MTIEFIPEMCVPMHPVRVNKISGHVDPYDTPLFYKLMFVGELAVAS